MGRKTCTGTSRYPQAQQLIGSILYDLHMMCKGKPKIFICIKSRLTKYLEMTPKDSNEASSYLDMFLSSRVPEAMVKLYKVRAHDFIQHLITSSKDELQIHDSISRLVLKFYELLRTAVRHGDPLYIFCRASLESMLNKTSVSIIVQGIFPIVDVLASKLSQGLPFSREIGPSSTDVHEFNNLLRCMMNAIVDPKALDTLIPRGYYRNHAWYDRDQLGYLYSVYLKLMAKLKTCLTEMGDEIKVITKVKHNGGWDQYLPILKQLHYISQLYEGTEETFWMRVEPHQVALCYLIVKYAKRSNIDDYKWIITRKDLIDFETKRHWFMMILPEVKQDYQNSHKMFSIIGFQDIIPFVSDLVAKLSHGLVSSMESTGPSSTDVHVLNMVFHYIVNATINSNDSCGLNFVYSIYLDLFEKMKACLYRMENDINVIVTRDGGCDQYLPILKILHSTSQLYGGKEDTFWLNLRPYKVVICYLIVEYAKRSDFDDYIWIINRKDVTDFETTSHLIVSSGVPESLVRLYTSPHDGNKEFAQNYIQHIFTSRKDKLEEPVYLEVCAPIVLQFLKLLCRDIPRDDPLYKFCRTTLESMLNYLHGASIAVQDIYPVFDGLATKLSEGLVSSMKHAGPCSTDVNDFSILLRLMMKKITDPKDLETLVPNQYYHKHPWYDSQVGYLCSLYLHLLTTLTVCLTKLGENIREILKGERDGRWNQYLPILRLLHSNSQLYGGEEENFWRKLRNHKVELFYLVDIYAKDDDDDDDYKWILNRKDLTGFETRRHLVMMLLPKVTEACWNSHRMLINRSDLLAESFKSITGATTDSLRGPIYIEFKNEEANGPGVLREWFMFVCQAIFNPHNALFLPCPTDRRRFFPNPASEVNPGHLEYFRFAGRVIALALIHKMQVGIVLARPFYLQLAGKKVSWKDIKDADPYLYMSCKQIMEMDPSVVDQDVLGLTFTWEFEALGVKKVVELCSNGEQRSVDSTNRNEYIDLIIKHQFVTSISEKLSNFSKGFVEIVGNEKNMKLCFQILEDEYLDGMLCGSECDISVDDWEAHTQYKGYKENDPQIDWFWKIVRKMSVEQRQVLLFFWTSVKYLPVEGFRGLASNLYIMKSDEKYGRLPSSHTCYYQICIPAYPSMAVMQERLNIITQEWVGCSFGSV